MKVSAQKNEFSFTKENLKKANEIVAKYPAGRQASAVLPLLDMAQRQAGGWIPPAALEYVAEFLEMPSIRVYEVASFYTMFNLKPVGKHLIQLCRTSPCWLRGSDDVREACKKHLGIELGETTKDGQFSLMEVECLGACVDAPVMQINDDFYENLDAKKTIDVLDSLKKGGKNVK